MFGAPPAPHAKQPNTPNGAQSLPTVNPLCSEIGNAPQMTATELTSPPSPLVEGEEEEEAIEEGKENDEEPEVLEEGEEEEEELDLEAGEEKSRAMPRRGLSPVRERRAHAALPRTRTVTVPLPIDNHTDATDLLAHATENLRCISWEQMSYELMSSSSGGAETYNLSRPVRTGEQIDFFLSHSWHDNAEKKWAALEKHVERFKKSHGGRAPTFWLDKVQILR